MKKRFALIGLLVLPVGCASIGRSGPDPVELRLNALESENQALRDQVSEQQRMLNGMGAVGLGSSVARLEEELRGLRGQMEELAFAVGQQDERQRALYIDLDGRLQALEGGKPASTQSNLTKNGNGDQKAYLNAFQLLKSGSYAKAASGFAEFLERYGDSPYAPNAQYWLGEAYYVQRDFDSAWKAFARVLDRFPTSSKAPDAMLKQALLRVEQGELEQARERLKETLARFPSSSAAKLAQEHLQKLGDS